MSAPIAAPAHRTSAGIRTAVPARSEGGASASRRLAGRALFALTLAGGLALAGCGTGAPHHQAAASRHPAPTQATAAPATVTLISLPRLGQVLADGSGHALYMFPPDASQRVSCTGGCADDWPPESVTSGVTPTAGPGVNPKLLGTLPDPSTGRKVVTYAGHPLYRYIGDPHPHTANGQAMFDDGGPWYVLRPDGTPVTAPLNGRS